jgi:hypothetical protein
MSQEGGPAGESPAAPSGESPQDPGAAGSSGGTPETPTPTRPDGESPTPTGESPAEVVRQREEARREAAAERRKRQEVESELRRRDEAAMSESERTAARLATAEERTSALESELRSLRIQTRSVEPAREAGATRPETIWRVLSPSEVEYDDDGSPTNLPALIEKAKAEFPELFRATPARPHGSADGGARTPASDRQVTPGIDRLRHAHETGQGRKEGARG